MNKQHKVAVHGRNSSATKAAKRLSTTNHPLSKAGHPKPVKALSSNTQIEIMEQDDNGGSHHHQSSENSSRGHTRTAHECAVTSLPASTEIGTSTPSVSWTWSAATTPSRHSVAAAQG